MYGHYSPWMQQRRPLQPMMGQPKQPGFSGPGGPQYAFLRNQLTPRQMPAKFNMLA